MRPLYLAALSAVLSFAAVWCWVATVPMGFLDAEYVAWHAKQIMLDRCDLGEAVILGDSRAAADLIPARLPIRITNLAIGGGGAIEAMAGLDRVLRCPVPPKWVLISIDPGHFNQSDMFWDRSVRFGWLNRQDISSLRDASRQVGDWSVYQGNKTNGLPLLARDWLYRVHFPPLYFANLVRSGVFLRWWRNETSLKETLAMRGHYYFGRAAGSSIVALDGHLDTFHPLPIEDHYFNRLLEKLDSRGIEARFMAMPINEATWHEVKPALREGFAAYLAGYEARYKHFHVASAIMPHWPDRFFGDQFCHLNPEGAERFSDWLSQRLQEAPPSTQNEAQKGWLSDTGADASFKLEPISKRGS